MWIIKIKNVESGEMMVHETEYSIIAFGTADVLNQFSRVPYRCYIKWIPTR